MKVERAEVLLLAAASLLLRGGERVRLLGQRTGGSLTAMAAALAADGPGEGLPPMAALPAHGRVVLIGDFLQPLEEMERNGRKARGHPRARPSAADPRPGGSTAAV